MFDWILNPPPKSVIESTFKEITIKHILCNINQDLIPIWVEVLDLDDC